MSFTWNASPADYSDAIRTAVRLTALALAAECTKQIEATTWDWPNPPSPRDIVESGQLRSSQLVQQLEEFVWEILYPTEYAAAVCNGYVTSKGNVMPGRNWFRAAAERIDIERTFRAFLAQQL